MEAVCPECGQIFEIPCDIEDGRHLQCYACNCKFSFVEGRVVPLANDDCNFVRLKSKKIDLMSIDPFGESNKPNMWKRFLYKALYVFIAFFIATIMLGIINSLSCSGNRKLSVGERLIQNPRTSDWRAE